MHMILLYLVLRVISIGVHPIGPEPVIGHPGLLSYPA